MGCDCVNYVDCHDPQMEVPAGNYEGFEFSREYTLNSVSSTPMEFHRKISRRFHAQASSTNATYIDYVVGGCESPVPCGSSDGSMISACSESCVMEVNMPYYWDWQRNIFVWKHIQESLSWNITSDKTALFRQKFGNIRFHKICIPKSIRTSGTETFLMCKDGVKTVVATSSYTYNPFPSGDGGGTWGLYGNEIHRNVQPDTPDVALIIILPNVPSQSIPLDNDVLYYGFYDYYSVEGGFVRSDLAATDGGDDYFYPYWCRAMPHDPIWRATADLRYEAIEAHQQNSIAGTVNWIPDAPECYPWPVGGHAVDAKNNFVTSLILPFSSRAGGGGVVLNSSNLGNIHHMMDDIKLPLSGYTTLYPVAPL